jgi:CRP-like cAMP-binding protein
MADEGAGAAREEAIEQARRALAAEPGSSALRLQLADLLVEAGQGDEAVPLFLALSDDFASRGLLARAAAALRRAEDLEPGNPEVNARRHGLQERTGEAFRRTAPGPRGRGDDDTNPKILLPGETGYEAPPRPPRPTGPHEDFLTMPEDAVQDQLEGLMEGLYLPAVGEAPPPAPSTTTEGGLSGLLLSELPAEERRAVLAGLKLRAFEPGDILTSEGEPPAGLVLVTAGSLWLHARGPDGRNTPVGLVEEGDFFGEVSSVPGLPRAATVVAAAPGEMLELHQEAVDRIALDQPRVWARMHALARERQAEREASRSAAPLDAGPAEPRMRLRLVKAFLRAGQQDEARRILMDLADELVRRGQSEKAIALLKRVEGLRPAIPPQREAPTPAAGRQRPLTDDRLPSWITALARSVKGGPRTPARRLWGESLADPETLRAQAGLRTSPLFEGLGDESLLAFVQKLPLESRGPGEILLTEGEPADDVLVLAYGRVKVFVRQRSGRDGLLRELLAGAFLGEIGVISAGRRTATATIASSSLLLRVDPPALEELFRIHPPAREVLEEAAATRLRNPEEAPLRERTRTED